MTKEGGSSNKALIALASILAVSALLLATVAILRGGGGAGVSGSNVPGGIAGASYIGSGFSYSGAYGGQLAFVGNGGSAAGGGGATVLLLNGSVVLLKLCTCWPSRLIRYL